MGHRVSNPPPETTDFSPAPQWRGCHPFLKLTLLAFLSPIFTLFSIGSVFGQQSDVRVEEALAKLSASNLISISFERVIPSYVNNTAFAEVKIVNKSQWDIQDITYEWDLSGGSGTVALSGQSTLFEIVPAFSTQTFHSKYVGEVNLDLPNRGLKLRGFKFRDFKGPSMSKVLTPDQMAAVKKAYADAAAKAKIDAAKKTLEFQQKLADKGDAYGQFKMGIRYLTGDGVDKDPAKARDLLAKSAAQGNKDAADQLTKLAAK